MAPSATRDAVSEPPGGCVVTMPRRWPADAELLAAVARGDEGALRGIWDRHAGSVARVLRAQLGADPVVDDLLQEVFVAFWSSASRVRNSASLRGFLIGIAVRKAASEIRRRKRKSWLSFLPTHGLPEIVVEPESPVLESLRRILATLSERQHQVFWLRYVEELEITEVSELVRVSESTTKRELRRARERVVTLARLDPALQPLIDSLEVTP